MRVLLAALPGLLGDALARLVDQLDPGSDIVRLPDPRAGLKTAASSEAFQLVLLDIDALGASPVPTVSEWSAAFDRVPVVVVSSGQDDQLIKEVFDAGAAGFLPTSYSESAMLAALRLVVEGAKAQQRASVPHAPEHKSNRKDLPEQAHSAFGLTERQLEVLSLAAQGKTNQAIAKQLGIAEGTVKLHMNAIFKALNVTNRSEAILIASRTAAVRSQQIRQAEEGSLDLDWLLPHMTHRRLTKDTVVFRKGDPGNQLFYLQRGGIRLPEINERIPAGNLFGEIGIFSPAHERTCSAVCETDVDLFSLTEEQVKQIYYLNPQFAFFVVNLIAKRLMADRARDI